MAPPENAIVICVDEKPSIQALERAQGYLKLPNGRALTGHSHDYKRNGTTSGAIADGSAASGSASLTDLQIAYLPLERLRPSPNNARTHSNKQLKQIVRSIERFGFVNPVLISDDFEIIAGHGRVEAAKLLRLKKVPTVRLSNLSPAERRAYVITDNRLAELAGWDRELLASELEALLELQFDDIELTGFSLGELDFMLDEAVEKKAEKPGREDELPANSLQGPAVSRRPEELGGAPVEAPPLYHPHSSR